MTDSITPRPFDRVLVANRGEIAVRVIRTLRRLGIDSVAVYSDADADATHVRHADRAVRLGPAAASESYLDPARLVAAALASGAQAVHPGYGFLSESAPFARACAEAGLVFVGPGEHALELMGDKIRAKLHVATSGVPTVPGIADASLDDDALVAAGVDVGFPLLVKPSAGGGGKGMQIVRSADELGDAIAQAHRVATAAFGDDTLLLERLIERPRHIEVQILADAHGNVIHLGERECSLQRRHQKVIEEAPSPLLDARTRARIGESACDAARSVDYRGAGTVEFLVSDLAPDEFFFIEMNTRLQVEHPVTESVTGIDLVEAQLRVAAGEQLAFTQGEVTLTGHAIEARVYAEDADHGFLPSTGELLAWAPPTADGVRVDAGVETGQHVTSHYDPMLAKIIAHGSDRAEALARLDLALADTVALGVDTNLAFLRRLLAVPEVQTGHIDTGLIERMPQPAPDENDDLRRALAARALLEPTGEASRSVPNAWSSRGWRAGGRRVARVMLAPRGDPANVSTIDLDANDDIGTATRSNHSTTAPTATTAIAPDGTAWVHAAGGTAAFVPVDRRTAMHARLAVNARGGKVDPELRAPMPGSVTAVLVIDGDHVDAGAPVLAIEAMKMEHRVLATVAGAVRLEVAVGDQVSRDQTVARLDTDVADPAASAD